MSDKSSSTVLAPLQNRLLNATLAFFLVLMVVFVLMAGRSVLVPFAVSILLWFIINALSRFLREKSAIGKFQLPTWASLTLSLILVLTVCAIVAEVVASNVQAMAERVPQYMQNIDVLTAKLTASIGSDVVRQVSTFVNGLNFESVALELANGAAGILGSTGAIILYVAFLLVEQQFIDKKLKALFGSKDRQAKVGRVLDDIGKRVRTYLFTKSLTSMAMAGVVWVFLEIAGIDFAGFWAFLVFILNFIPVVGGIVSGVFPAVLALVQFPTFEPFLMVIAGVGTAHLVIGNIVEPRYVGNSVNLSPLVVILALAVWGFIWGVPGMFLCVPLTVIGMIIFTEFKSTRPIAIALSENGEVGLSQTQPQAQT